MTFDDDFHKPQFSSKVLCDAAQIDQATLKNWLLRTPAIIVLTDKEKEAYSARSKRVFSLSRILQIAAVADLTFNGYDLRHAATVLADFYYSESNETFPFQGIRSPGDLYPTGQSIIVLRKGDEVGRMYNIHIEKSVDNQMLKIWETGGTVINMSALYDRVYSHLKLIDERA